MSLDTTLAARGRLSVANPADGFLSEDPARGRVAHEDPAAGFIAQAHTFATRVTEAEIVRITEDGAIRITEG